MSIDKRACGCHCIKIKNFSVKYGNEIILKDVSQHIHCGCLTAIIGPNGAGKSTLIKAILNEVKHEGEVEFMFLPNHHCTHQTEECSSCNAMAEKLKLKIGYVPQHLNLSKNAPTSVYDLFAGLISDFPIFLSKRKKLYMKIKDQLAMFQAQELIEKDICDLSGGELQRVLLSIATTPIPNLLLLDEPVSGIDHNGMELFYRNITQLKENYDLAIILVSHDLEFVAKYADHVVLLNHQVIQEGTPSEVFASNEFKQIFGNISFGEDFKWNS